MNTELIGRGYTTPNFSFFYEPEDIFLGAPKPIGAVTAKSIDSLTPKDLYKIRSMAKKKEACDAGYRPYMKALRQKNWRKAKEVIRNYVVWLYVKGILYIDHDINSIQKKRYPNFCFSTPGKIYKEHSITIDAEPPITFEYPTGV